MLNVFKSVVFMGLCLLLSDFAETRLKMNLQLCFCSFIIEANENQGYVYKVVTLFMF